MNSHGKVSITLVERRETIEFLKRYMHYDKSTRTNSNLVRKCYCLKIITLFENKNDLVNDFNIFKYTTKGSGDNCEDSKVPNRQSQVRDNFLSYHEKLIVFFDKIYNKNRNYEIRFDGYYPVISFKQNIVEKTISLPVKSKFYRFQNKKQQNEEKQNEREDKLIFINDNEFSFSKFVLLLLSVLLPISKTVRRFSKAELIMSSSLLYVIVCGFTFSNLNGGFYQSSLFDIFQQFNNKSNLTSLQKYALDGASVAIDDLIKQFAIFVDPKFWLVQFIALLLSAMIVALLFKYCVRNRFPVSEIYFISLNTTAIVTLSFSMLLIPYLENRNNMYLIILIICLAFYRIFYPIFSIKNLLDVKLRYSLVIYGILILVYMPLQKYLYLLVNMV